jgi:hypothetical protein
MSQRTMSSKYKHAHTRTDLSKLKGCTASLLSSGLFFDMLGLENRLLDADDIKLADIDCMSLTANDSPADLLIKGFATPRNPSLCNR